MLRGSPHAAPMMLCVAVLLAGIWQCQSATEDVGFGFQASANARQYLSEDYFPGMHLLDLEAGMPGYMMVYKGTQLPGKPKPFNGQLMPFKMEVPGSLEALLSKLEEVLKIPPIEELQNKRAFFDHQGSPIADIETFKLRKVAFLLEIGVWIWPPVAVGFTQEARDVEGNTMMLKTLSLRPKIFEVRNFISLNETEAVMALGKKQGLHSSKGQMQSADVAKGTADGEFRTSKQAWLHSGMSPVIKTLDERVAGLTRVPQDHQEPAQLLRYDQGTYYHNHMDWGELELYPDQKDMWVEGHMGHQDRLATVFWYLNDVPEGGETNFPKQGQRICSPLSMGGPKHRHCRGTDDGPPSSCRDGLKVKPERGTVVMWYNFHASGRGDVNALHAGCPVGKGLVKWSANKWIRVKSLRSRGRWVEGHPAIKRFGWKGENAPQDPNFCTVTFESEFAEGADIMWQGGGSSENLGPLEPGMERSMNSHKGHKFFVQAGGRKTNTVKCKPPQIHVRLTAAFALKVSKTSKKEL